MLSSYTTVPYSQANMDALHRACRDVDGIITNITLLTEASAIGQKYQIPVILAPCLPFSPSGEVRNRVVMSFHQFP
jgi:hypothetical protein